MQFFTWSGAPALRRWGCGTAVGVGAQVLTALVLVLAVQLVDGDVQVAVGGDGHGVGPQRPRVVHQRLDGAVGQPAQDGVVLEGGDVDPSGVIGLQAVGAGALVASSTTVAATASSSSERSSRASTDTLYRDRDISGA